MEHSKLPHSKLPWRATEGSESPGIRNDAGFICFLKDKPFHYHGQDERYEQEMREWQGNLVFIAKACNEHDTLKAKAELFDEAIIVLNDIARCPNSANCCTDEAHKITAKAKELK